MRLYTVDSEMKNRVCAAIAALALVLLSAFLIVPEARAEMDGMVRVKLTRLGAPEAITMTADCDYYLAADASVRVAAGTQLTVSAQADGLTLRFGEQKMALGGSVKLMRAASGNRGMRFLKPELSGRFCGDLGFSASGGVVSAVLHIYIENYLYGVVGYEMPPLNAIEALKAQAVAARTYALRKKAARRDAAYDLTDTTADQVFKGYNASEEYVNVIRAVDETRGGVLFCNGELAQCYYCASNGGQTESAKNAWGTALDYTPVQDDPYDLESGAMVKSVTINRDLSDIDVNLKSALKEGIRQQLEAHGISAETGSVSVNGIESITACDSKYAAPSRVYKSLTFKINLTVRDESGETRTGAVSVSIPTFGGIEEWCDLSINAEENETVWVAEADRAFTVSFRRFGHGVGMSQRGAQVMAASYGKSAVEILTYYYPGVTGRVLELSDGTHDEKAVSPKPEQAAIATARLSGKTDLLNAAKEDGASTATVAAGAKVDVYAVQGEWAAVGSGDKYGFVHTDDLQAFALIGSAVTRPEESAFGVALKDAQVLQLPVASAKAVSSMIRGDVLEVYAWTEAWVMLEATDGLVGFVPMDAVELSDAEGTAGTRSESVPASGASGNIDGGAIVRVKDIQYMYVAADTAFVYESWSRESGVIAALAEGDKVRLGAYNEQWACVRLSDGSTGYMLISALSAQKPAF